MKGPKKFTKKEKEEIERRYREDLEEKIDSFEEKLAEATVKIDMCLTDLKVSIESYLSEQGIECEVVIKEETRNFFSYNSSLRYKKLIRLDINPPDSDPEGKIILTDEQKEHVEELRSSYSNERNSFTMRLVDLIQGCFPDYREMMECLMIDEPFEQIERQSKAILYVVDPEKPVLLRTMVDFLTGRFDKLEESDILTAFANIKTTEYAMRREAEQENANVYIISHPRKEIPTKAMVGQAHAALMHGYDMLDTNAKQQRCIAMLKEHVGDVEGVIYISGENLHEMLDAIDSVENLECALDKLMEGHEGEVVSKDVYERVCPLCPGSEEGCKQYEKSKILYEAGMDPDKDWLH